MESSIVRITGYTKLQAITDRRPAFGSTAPGAWTELPPFPVFNGEKAVITTKLSAIFDLKPGKTVLDTSCFDIAGGQVITGPAYKNLDTHQMYDPENVPDGLYWRRNYCGIFGSYILDDVFYAVIHGENKNEIVEEKTMTKIMKVNGMNCNHCKMAVEKALSSVEGVTAAEVNLAEKLAVITLASDVSDEALTAVVADAGFEPVGVTAE